MIFALVFASAQAQAAPLSIYASAYPEAVSSAGAAGITLKSGLTLPAGPDQADRPFDYRLGHASLIDQLSIPYTPGPLAAPPTTDPGRLRNKAFFDAVYGDCHKGEVTKNLVAVMWGGERVMFNARNGAADHLRAVSMAVEKLPPAIRRAAHPTQGTYACRAVADAGQPSMHAYGAAIDLAANFSEYWLWANGPHPAKIPYKNRMPAEIVAAFEAEGFIWGGKWVHYDTMHFEYRPELLPPASSR